MRVIIRPFFKPGRQFFHHPPMAANRRALTLYFRAIMLLEVQNRDLQACLPIIKLHRLKETNLLIKLHQMLAMRSAAHMNLHKVIKLIIEILEGGLIQIPTHHTFFGQLHHKRGLQDFKQIFYECYIFCPACNERV